MKSQTKSRNGVPVKIGSIIKHDIFGEGRIKELSYTTGNMVSNSIVLCTAKFGDGREAEVSITNFDVIIGE